MSIDISKSVFEFNLICRILKNLIKKKKRNLTLLQFTQNLDKSKSCENYKVNICLSSCLNFPFTQIFHFRFNFRLTATLRLRCLWKSLKTLLAHLNMFEANNQGWYTMKRVSSLSIRIAEWRAMYVSNWRNDVTNKARVAFNDIAHGGIYQSWQKLPSLKWCQRLTLSPDTCD